MSKKGHPFNIILSPEQVTQLSKLATARNCSQAQIIRYLLHRAYSMQFLNLPTCADGQRCYVPHMHVDMSTLPPPPPTHTDGNTPP